MCFSPHHLCRDKIRRWIERKVECYRSDGFGLLAIEDRASGDVIGDCGPTIQQVDGEALVELGWHVLRARQGEGIATEAARACRDHLLATTEISPLIALVRPENAPSRRAAEKLGMSVWRETLHAGCGHLVYALHRAA